MKESTRALQKLEQMLRNAVDRAEEAERQRDDLLAVCDKALICVQNGDWPEAGWHLYSAIARAEPMSTPGLPRKTRPTRERGRHADSGI